jgi:hypothetical protein
MRVHRIVALVVTALSLTITSAHLLEMPAKLGYDLELYTTINETLYRYFRIIGAIYEIAAVVVVATLAWRSRDQRSAGYVIAAAVGVSLSFMSWLGLVLPVDHAIAHGASWAELRTHWEYGQAVGFVCSLASFVALAVAIVPDDKLARRA